MKKNLVALLSGIFLVLVATGIFMFMQMDNMAKRTLEKYASAITGTPVSVAKITISPSTGEGSVTYLTIRNPAGFGTDYALKMNSTHVAVDVKSLPTDVVIIKEVVMDAPEIIYEVNEHGNNFAVLRTNVNEYLAHDETASEEKIVASKQVIIKDFYLRNGKVKVIAPSLQNQSFEVSIPTIHLSNVGEGQGKGNLPRVMQQIMNVVTNTIVSSVGNVTLQNFVKFLPNTVTGVANGVLNETGTAIQNVGEGIGEVFK
jgi:hypothetical protein